VTERCTDIQRDTTITCICKGHENFNKTFLMPLRTI